MDSLSCRYLVSRVPGRRAGRVVASCPAWLGSTTKRRSFVERVPEKSVFAELVAADRSAVWAVRLRITGNRADAEDALHDTLLGAWRKLAQFRSDAEFSIWLFRIAANAALAIVRRRPEIAKIWALSRYMSSATDPGSVPPTLSGRWRHRALTHGRIRGKCRARRPAHRNPSPPDRRALDRQPGPQCRSPARLSSPTPIRHQESPNLDLRRP
ncbi:RNA polymerase sigma factor [Mycobacterium sp.]|uniref:RNA polymerase sigma factor n=1 Tax=Mycobacterium sp. TaxID=1785 RepID=UPI003F953757